MILGPLLLKKFLRDLFLERENCCYANYADDTTTYIAANNTGEVLAKITQRLFILFANNQTRANHGKSHLLCSTLEDANIQISNATINCLRSQKLLDIVYEFRYSV